MKWLRKLIQGPPGAEAITPCGARRVFPAASPAQAADPQQRRILTLASGQTVAQLVDALYRQEVNTGGQEVDLGLWQAAFNQQALRAIFRMAEAGLLELRAAETPAARAPEAAPPEPLQRSSLPPEQTALTAS